jgi:hypothetical protein
MKFRITSILIFCICYSLSVRAQNGQPVSSIRGVITDHASGAPLSYTTIGLLDTPAIGTASDVIGQFILKDVPVGRHTVRVSLLGYEPVTIHEVLVSSGKEVFLEISLKENVRELSEVTVTPQVKKDLPLNKMAVAGARMLSVEEASRYAGGFDDPARLVTSFAGVAGTVSSNSISIRGNSPQFLQWKLEGVEIPNPCHYPDITGVGGGILTAFSSQVLGNSDFFTGAFPAEYNNALSGVFDMQLRNGNNQNYEHTAQIGTIGVEFASEGPFKKGGKSSYLFNYHYSSMALAGALMPGALKEVAGMRYQDLSFKLNFPTKRAGTFSVWGIGTFDKYSQAGISDTTKWEGDNDRNNTWTNQSMAAVGVGHKYFFDNNTFLKTTLSGTYASNHVWADWLETDMSTAPLCDLLGDNANIVLNTCLNKKFSVRHTNRTGITLTGLYYDMDYSITPYFPQPSHTMVNFADSRGHSMLASAFSQSLVNLNERWTAEIGFNAQYFMLNQHWTVEPRLGLKWQAAQKHSFALTYGMHSRHEKLDYYFITTPSTGNKLVNKNLDFAKAHHFVSAYDWHILDNLHLKAEPYFQYLYDVPVTESGSFSIINQFDWYLDKALVNDGKGKNYGIDLTLERYLADGYYYMLTASLFESRYQGGDGVWRDTRLNRQFLMNALYGKEWMVGKQKQNILGVNLRVMYQGGEHYTPINEFESKEQKRVVFDENLAMQGKMDPALVVDFTISYKINKKHTSHEIAFKMLNATGYKEYEGFQYFYRTGEIKMMTGAVMVPNLSYKIEF